VPITGMGIGMVVDPMFTGGPSSVHGRTVPT